MENKIKTNDNNKESQGKKGFAVLLVLIGSILLAFNLELIPGAYQPILISWQMLLIVLGLLALIKRQFTSGIIMISVGVFFMLPIIGCSFPELLNGTLHNAHNYWPVLLIIGGILFLFKKNDHNKYSKYWQPKTSDSNIDEECSSTNTGTGNNYIDKSIMFNSSEDIVFSSNFRGGEANVLFGEVKLDLRKISGLDKNNKLEANALFGSIIIYIPEKWQINLKSSVLFGNIQDNRHVIDVEITDETPFLNLEANCMFGNIEFRN